MDVVRVLTGLMLAFVISSINWLAGIGYTVGGEFLGAVSLSFTGSEIAEDPRLVVEITEDGRKSIKPKNALSAVSIVASTKIGAFGIFLQIFVWLQIIAGLILIFRRAIGAVLGIFLGFVAVGGVATEIVGAALTSSFGITNALGSIVAILVGIVTFWMYQAKSNREVAVNAP